MRSDQLSYQSHSQSHSQSQSYSHSCSHSHSYSHSQSHSCSHSRSNSYSHSQSYSETMTRPFLSRAMCLCSYLCLLQASFSRPQPSSVLIDSVKVDLRDSQGGSVKATFTLMEGRNPAEQAEDFCSLYFLGPEHCAVLRTRAMELYDLYQVEKQVEHQVEKQVEHQGDKGEHQGEHREHQVEEQEGHDLVTEREATEVLIASVPVVLLSPEGGTVNAEFSLFVSEDPTVQAQAFCVLHNLSGEYCAILSERAVQMYTHYSQASTPANANVPVEDKTDTEEADEFDDLSIVHTIPVMILAPTGETVTVDFVLHDSSAPESQVLEFCDRYDLTTNTCSKLLSRAKAIFDTYQSFITLLNQDPVSPEEGNSVPRFASIRDTVFAEAHMQTETYTEQVDSTSAITDEVKDSPSPNYLVLDLLEWGLSADLLSVQKPPLPPSSASSSSASTPEMLSHPPPSHSNEQDSFWANFALSEEYFAIVAGRR